MKKILPLSLVAMLFLTACNSNGANKDYVSEDPAQCQVLRFQCDEGEIPFFDETGCGCETDQTMLDDGLGMVEGGSTEAVVETNSETEAVTSEAGTETGEEPEADIETTAVAVESVTEVVSNPVTIVSDEPCSTDYDPVCAQTRNHCTDSDCEPAMQTFANRCQAEKAEAFNIQDGACPVPDMTPSTGMGPY